MTDSRQGATYPGSTDAGGTGSGRTLRLLDAAEHRAAQDVFAESLHLPPPDDAAWQRQRHSLQPQRVWGTFEGSELVGTARSMDVSLAVPGGVPVPAAAVTGVGVRAHRTRRGVLRSLMQAQLAELAERGVAAAGLLSSEGAIYGRFGYGIATVERSLSVQRARAAVDERAPGGGTVAYLDFEQALRELPGIDASLPAPRAGMISRPSYYWATWEDYFRSYGQVARAAVYYGTGGVEGYAMYRVERRGGEEDSGAVLHLVDMVTVSEAAFAGLWRFLLSVDLVERIEARSRPVDEPVEALLRDPDACRVTGQGHHLWLRLIDVPTALAARHYGGAGRGGQDAVVLEVHDPLLPANAGRYRVSAEGAARTEAPAQLATDAETLAMLYLGAWRASALAGVGRLRVIDPAAVPAAERLFAGSGAPWCGTHF